MWLRSITVNRCRRHWRAQHPPARAISDVKDLEDPHSGISRLWDREHDRHVVKVLLERIRPEFDDRTWGIFERLVFEEASAGDVARDLGTSPNAIYITKARVLKRLRLEGKGLVE
jgi:RNA polymerase sigma-70 factor (ECF subfamily)